MLQECDTLLIIGSNDPWTEFYPPPGQARAVQIDNDPAKLGNRYPVEVSIAGDSAPSIKGLLERIPARGQTPWQAEVERQVRNWHQISRLRAEVPAAPLNPERVVREFAGRVPADAQLAVDVGSSVYHYVRQMDLPTSVTAHLSSTLASMGCAVPYGISAKETAPHRPVVAVAGDGAMQMLGINELITVAERWRQWQDPRFVILVIHNQDLAEVSWEQREFESQPRFAASQDIPQFDFAGYAELLGLRGLRLSDSQSIGEVLDEAFDADMPCLIEALTDPDVPLLPPFPHGKNQLDPMRTGLEAEGEAGKHALDLLAEYVRIEEDHQ